MAGANIVSKNRLRLKELFWKYLTQTNATGGDKGYNRLGHERQGLYPTWLAKQGVPASNTAADAPDRKGQICIDLTNKDVYICTAFTNSTTFTWLKISD
jgi:hypothetical protein